RILGHMIVGTVEPGGSEDAGGRRVGVPWLGWTDGECEYCRSGRENLCPNARFTGRDIDGGYAEYALADERYCFALPPSYTDEQAARLLWAGLTGYRAAGCTPSPDPAATRRCRLSPASSERCGQARRMSRRHSRSTPRSSSPPL